MNKWPIALGSLTAIVLGVVAVLALAGVFDSDSASPGGGEEADTAAMCVEGVEDCDDTVAIPIDGDDDDADAGDGASGTCLEGTPDCNDTPADGDPVPRVPTGDDAQALAIEAAFAELEAIGGPILAGEAEVTEVRAVDWPNACLGIETPGIACAQVITPGFVIVLDTGLLAFTFHTDANGHAVLAEPAE